MWDAPAGLTGVGAIVVVTSGLHTGSGASGNVSGRQELVVQSGKQKAESPGLTKLSQLPNRCWTDAEQDVSGIQFFTRVRIGLSKHQLLIDWGSGVNSTTEELVLQVLNECQAVGLKLSDPKHPVKMLE